MEESLALVAETSTQYIGRWNRLVSTTNWEKGRILCEWRQALQEAGAPAGSYTDEVWSQQVGGITPQHVGRLRRVHERFGQVYKQYRGLYWSHFQVSVEWPDAEMWLEGAVQNLWSVARMCDQRCEALGGPPDSQLQEADFLTDEADEDVTATGSVPPATISDAYGEVHGDVDAQLDDNVSSPGVDAADRDEPVDSAANAATAEPMRPFESMPSLPPDMNEAFELFKLAILNHKVSGWREIARKDVLKVLDSLRQLALAPAE